jgi:adenylate cyclase
MSDEQPKTYFGMGYDEYWRQVLNAEGPGLDLIPRVFRKVPHGPRCKLCRAPFHGPFAPLFRLAGFRRWSLNAQICRYCVGGVSKKPGGAEVDVSLLFADVRGSTTLAEEMSPSQFTKALNRFFSLAAEAVDVEDGVIDHIVGDGVMAMWVPGFVGDEHPARAVAAGRRLAQDLMEAEGLGDAFPAGVGVHTGVAYVGVVGEEGSFDFTVLGDVANTTARLGSAAGGGELAMSDAIAAAAHVDTSGLEHRMLDLKGKAGSFPAWIEHV